MSAERLDELEGRADVGRVGFLSARVGERSKVVGWDKVVAVSSGQRLWSRLDPVVAGRLLRGGLE